MKHTLKATQLTTLFLFTLATLIAAGCTTRANTDSTAPQASAEAGSGSGSPTAPTGSDPGMRLATGTQVRVVSASGTGWTLVPDGLGVILGTRSLTQQNPDPTVWNVVSTGTELQLMHPASGRCLHVSPTNEMDLGDCSAAGSTMFSLKQSTLPNKKALFTLQGRSQDGLAGPDRLMTARIGNREVETAPVASAAANDNAWAIEAKSGGTNPSNTRWVDSERFVATILQSTSVLAMTSTHGLGSNLFSFDRALQLADTAGVFLPMVIPVMGWLNGGYWEQLVVITTAGAAYRYPMTRTSMPPMGEVWRATDSVTLKKSNGTTLTGVQAVRLHSNQLDFMVTAAGNDYQCNFVTLRNGGNCL